MSAPLILLADDDTIFRTLLADALSAEGFQVLAAADGNQAKEHFDRDAKREIGLFITDMVMPGVDGLELALTMRQSRPELGVIVISGTEEPPELKIDRIAFFMKPFYMGELIAKIRELTP